DRPNFPFMRQVDAAAGGAIEHSRFSIRGTAGEIAAVGAEGQRMHECGVTLHGHGLFDSLDVHEKDAAFVAAANEERIGGTERDCLQAAIRLRREEANEMRCGLCVRRPESELT